MKKAILSLALALPVALSFMSNADAATLDSESKKIYVNGSSWDSGLGESRIYDNSSGTVYALGATTYVGSSSVYVKIEAGVGGNYLPPAYQSTTNDSISIAKSLGPKDYTNPMHVYSTHKIYKNGTLAGSANTSASW
ncbi:hypothetical protein [Bacillus sp. ISL-37]|uniref:hypothetical protein n=1 Tax=Bacillus sp. ISL-37 TaxID=2819123 RepID=UPI001BEB51C1|nr:hypothetical protein [Bacillus sp. ISL-37]MBT2684885.1 hypothetical protein [Bacillus sp. ISL-37]